MVLNKLSNERFIVSTNPFISLTFLFCSFLTTYKTRSAIVTSFFYNFSITAFLLCIYNPACLNKLNYMCKPSCIGGLFYDFNLQRISIINSHLFNKLNFNNETIYTSYIYIASQYLFINQLVKFKNRFFSIGVNE